MKSYWREGLCKIDVTVYSSFCQKSVANLVLTFPADKQKRKHVSYMVSVPKRKLNGLLRGRPVVLELRSRTIFLFSTRSRRVPTHEPSVS